MTQINPRAATFEQSTIDAMTKLCESIQALIYSLPHQDQDFSVKTMQAFFGLHQQLAWQILRLLRTRDPLTEIANVPSVHGMESFLASADSCKILPKHVEAVRRAYNNWQSQVDHYADNLMDFNLMALSFQQESLSDQSLSKKLRREYHEAQARIYGIQMDTQLTVVAFAPSKTSVSKLDGLRLESYRNIQKLKSDARWVIGHPNPMSSPTDKATRSVSIGNCMESETLSQFSTFEPVVLNQSEIETGYHLQCTWNDFGKVGAQTYTTGRFCPEMWNKDHKSNTHCSVPIRVSTKRVYFDVLRHNHLNGAVNAAAKIVDDQGALGAGLWSRTDQDTQKLEVGVSDLGPSSEVGLQEIDYYASLLEYGFQHVEWDLKDFRTYRVFLEYPVNPSRVVIKISQ